MADSTTKTSGYATTATAVAWTSGTTFDSLADNGWTSLTDEIDNSTNKYLLADWYLALGSMPFTGADSGIEIFVVPAVDGTNYPTWTTGASDEQENQQYYRDFAPTTGTTAAQAVVSNSPILLPPGKFKFGFRNRGNTALASSGNSFSWRPHGYLADEA